MNRQCFHQQKWIETKTSSMNYDYDVYTRRVHLIVIAFNIQSFDELVLTFKIAVSSSERSLHR